MSVRSSVRPATGFILSEADQCSNGGQSLVALNEALRWPQCLFFPDLRNADVLSEMILGADWLVGIIHRQENPEFGTLASELLKISVILRQALLEQFRISL